MKSSQCRSLAVSGTLLAVLSWNLMLASGCAPKRVLRQPDGGRDAPARDIHAPVEASASALPDGVLRRGREVADLALAQLGRPYQWGGDQPHRGFDCSGLVRWSFGNVGVDLPRVVRDQRRAGRSIDPKHRQPGDLLFFRTRGNTVSHVGIYVGNSMFVHAPSVGQPVRTDRLNDPYWRERWTETRRIF